MPKISGFHGIAIWMYYDEPRHTGRPHFHADGADHEATVDIEDLEILAGGMSARDRRLVNEWAEKHRHELRDNWARARRHQPLLPIEPLP